MNETHVWHAPKEGEDAKEKDVRSDIEELARQLGKSMADAALTTPDTTIFASGEELRDALSAEVANPRPNRQQRRAAAREKKP